MKEKFNETINSIILSSVISFILGLIMIIFPKTSLETIGIMIAIYIIIHGCVLIFLDIKASKVYVPFNGLLSGILSLLFGILILCKPSILPVIFTFIIGIWMIASSINNIDIAAKISKTNLPWVPILLFGMLDLLAGVIMVFNPFEASISITLFSGIMLVIHSIINVIDMIILKRDAKKISEELNKIMKKSK